MQQKLNYPVKTNIFELLQVNTMLWRIIRCQELVAIDECLQTLEAAIKTQKVTPSFNKRPGTTEKYAYVTSDKIKDLNAQITKKKISICFINAVYVMKELDLKYLTQYIKKKNQYPNSYCIFPISPTQNQVGNETEPNNDHYSLYLSYIHEFRKEPKIIKKEKKLPFIYYPKFNGNHSCRICQKEIKSNGPSCYIFHMRNPEHIFKFSEDKNTISIIDQDFKLKLNYKSIPDSRSTAKKRYNVAVTSPIIMPPKLRNRTRSSPYKLCNCRYIYAEAVLYWKIHNPKLKEEYDCIKRKCPFNLGLPVTQLKYN